MYSLVTKLGPSWCVVYKKMNSCLIYSSCPNKPMKECEKYISQGDWKAHRKKCCLCIYIPYLSKTIKTLEIGIWKPIGKCTHTHTHYTHIDIHTSSTTTTNLEVWNYTNKSSCSFPSYLPHYAHITFLGTSITTIVKPLNHSPSRFYTYNFFASFLLFS